jgi:cell division transport system permease protein
MKRLVYLLKEAFINIRLNQTTTMVAVITTAFTMACFGIFLLVYYNLRGVTASLQDEIKVVAYLEDGLSADQVTDLQAKMKQGREVDSIDYLSKEDALADFREQFPSESYLLQGLGDNPLPASLVVTMAPEFRSSDSVSRWADRVRVMPGIAQVQYNQAWIESLSRVMRYIEWGAVGIGAILAAASVTIIGSTIRLTLYARRDDIEIMRLIGATGTFVRIPYLIEGAVLGALGSALSLSLLKAGYEFFSLKLGAQSLFPGSRLPFSFFPGRISLWIVTAGLVLGSLGSLVSLVAFERGKR